MNVFKKLYYRYLPERFTPYYGKVIPVGDRAAAFKYADWLKAQRNISSEDKEAILRKKAPWHLDSLMEIEFGTAILGCRELLSHLPEDKREIKDTELLLSASAFIQLLSALEKFAPDEAISLEREFLKTNGIDKLTLYALAAHRVPLVYEVTTKRLRETEEAAQAHFEGRTFDEVQKEFPCKNGYIQSLGRFADHNPNYPVKKRV